MGDRAEWARARVPAVGTQAIWGLPIVTANPAPLNRLTIGMREATGSGKSCAVRGRNLLLQPATVDGASTWRVVMEEGTQARPCPDTTIRSVLNTHQSLQSAWRSRDPEALKASVHGGFILRDGGVEARRYSVKDLSEGPGRWILEHIGRHAATAANTRLVGDAAVIRDELEQSTGLKAIVLDADGNPADG